MSPNEVQNQGQRPPQRSKTNKLCPGPKKIEFWRLGTSKMHAKRGPNSTSWRHQYGTKWTFQSKHQRPWKSGTNWRLKNTLLRSKMEALGTQVGARKPLSAHLRFLKDVLYVLHSFATEDTGSSLQKTCRENIFSQAAQSICPKPEKEIPEPSKSNLKPPLWSLWRHSDKASKTGPPKK